MRGCSPRRPPRSGRPTSPSRGPIRARAPAPRGPALGIAEHPALATIHARVESKLAREPVEDFRIDFEDGYGNRPDLEEDHHAGAAAAELSRGMRAGTLPP